LGLIAVLRETGIAEMPRIDYIKARSISQQAGGPGGSFTNLNDGPRSLKRTWTLGGGRTSRGGRQYLVGGLILQEHARKRGPEISEKKRKGSRHRVKSTAIKTGLTKNQEDFQGKRWK